MCVCTCIYNISLFDKRNKMKPILRHERTLSLPANDRIQWTDLDQKNAVDEWNLQVDDMIQRTCSTCAASHKAIMYKRLTDPGTIDFKNLFLHQVE